jgi:hypothetical protein
MEVYRCRSWLSARCTRLLCRWWSRNWRRSRMDFRSTLRCAAAYASAGQNRGVCQVVYAVLFQGRSMEGCLEEALPDL